MFLVFKQGLMISHLISFIMMCSTLLTQSASPTVWFCLTASFLWPVFTESEIVYWLKFFCQGFKLYQEIQIISVTKVTHCIMAFSVFVVEVFENVFMFTAWPPCTIPRPLTGLPKCDAVIKLIQLNVVIIRPNFLLTSHNVCCEKGGWGTSLGWHFF